MLTASGEVEEALAVRDRRIEAIGSAEEIRRWIGPETEVVELEGRALLPGFIDAHMHLVSQGLKETNHYLDLSGVSSPEDTLDKVHEAVRSRGTDEWVLGRGWDESRWSSRRYLTRQDLDRVAPQNPVALSRVDGHLLVANSQALLRITIEVPPEEFDPERGLLRERAVDQFLAQVQPSPEEIERAILAAVRLAHSLGVTSVHDVVTPEHVRAYQRLHHRGELALRVRLQIVVERLDELIALGLATGFGDEMLRLGAIKIFSDGSIGARNAALLEPYEDEPSTAGKLNYLQSELNALTKRAQENGFQLMIHAIGDRTIEAALDALGHAGVEPGDRARIEHFELPTEVQLERAQALGVVASMQPNFVQWSGPGRLYETRLGPERDARIDPHRAVLEWGIPLAFGSDGMPFGPLYGIHWAVNAPHPHQRLTVEEALHAYTLGAAYAGFDENTLGSLEPGKLADLIVLSEDPGEARGRLRELRVEETYLGGELVYRSA